jgi:hypothetical protein
MKSKLKIPLRRLVVGLAIGSASAITTLAQPVAGITTNAPAAQTAASPSRGWLTFGLDRIEWLQVTWLGNPLWQYLASLLYIVLALYASKLVDFLFQTQFKKLAARTNTKLDDVLLDLSKGPVKIIFFVILLHIGLRVFAWPDWVATFISNGLKIIVACSITYVALKCVDLGMGLWQTRLDAAQQGVLDMQLFPVIRNGQGTEP